MEDRYKPVFIFSSSLRYNKNSELAFFVDLLARITRKLLSLHHDDVSTIVWIVRLLVLFISHIFSLFVYAPTFEKFKLNIPLYNVILIGFCHSLANFLWSLASSFLQARQWTIASLFLDMVCGGFPLTCKGFSQNAFSCLSRLSWVCLFRLSIGVSV